MILVPSRGGHIWSQVWKFVAAVFQCGCLCRPIVFSNFLSACPFHIPSVPLDERRTLVFLALVLARHVKPRAQGKGGVAAGLVRPTALLDSRAEVLEMCSPFDLLSMSSSVVLEEAATHHSRVRSGARRW